MQENKNFFSQKNNFSMLRVEDSQLRVTVRVVFWIVADNIQIKKKQQQKNTQKKTKQKKTEKMLDLSCESSA